uniref:Uncharacterized protein n=1 Tax=Arundo donax TaxID=35708 RepID=A0A0A9AWL4_ARUDO
MMSGTTWMITHGMNYWLL